LKRAHALRLTVAAAALGALTVVGGGTAATAKQEAKASGAVVVTAQKQGKDIFFDAPKTVEKGQVLKFKSKTDPQKIGPHTFSLVTKKSFPQTNQEIKDCGKKLAAICGAVAIEWHEIDLDTGQTGEKVSEAGKNGWDTEGNTKRRGDSVFVGKENGSFKQTVSAPEGKTLHFICVVHPFMQGKIKVEG
jgi:hypothetical protein